MKHTKKIIALVLAIVTLLAFTACGAEKETPATLNIAALKGPTGIGMVQLMENSGTDTYNFTLAGAPDEVKAKIVNGEVDIAACPVNLAAALYKATNGNVEVLAVNTLGVLYILENGNTINSVADLKGKTLYATGKGATPEYILNYILKANGIDPENDITIEYKTEHSELATLAASGKAVISMLPEPNVTAVLKQNKDVRIALNLTEEWDKAVARDGGSSKLAQGCIIARKDFVEANPEAVSRFMDNYKKSVEFVNSNPADASVLVEKHGIMPKASIAQAAIPNCNITFIEGAEMKDVLSANLNVLFNANPKSIGGSMPGDDFYYSR